MHAFDVAPNAQRITRELSQKQQRTGSADEETLTASKILREQFIQECLLPSQSQCRPFQVRNATAACALEAGATVSTIEGISFGQL